MKKNNIIIIVLVLFVIGLASYIVYDKVINVKEEKEVNEKNTAKENTKKEEETNEKTLDVNSELVQNLYSMINPDDSNELLYELYINNSFTDKYKIGMSILKYLKENNLFEIVDGKKERSTSDKASYISEDTIKEYMQKIFGNSNYTNQDKVSLITDGICFYDYNNTYKRYENLANGCHGSNHKFYREIASAKSKDNKVYIREKNVYGFYKTIVTGGEESASVYSNPDKKVQVYFETGDNAHNVDLKNYIDNGSVYEYEFEKLDNNYILKSIKRLS